MQVSAVPAPLRLTIAARSGSIVVRSAPGAEVSAKGADVRREPDGSFRIDGGSHSLDVTCPDGADLILGTSSGKVRIEGRFGDVRVTSASGSLRIDSVATLDVRMRSGSVGVGSCAGDCHVVATSGRIEIGRAGRIDVGGRSGSISVQSSAGGRVGTTSGHIEVGLDVAADLEVRAVSSTIDIDVAPGIAPTLDLRSRTGHVRGDVREGNDCVISAHTVSGSITVR
jgi:DUF4097 and DUF4098 domain-containing protein YvlB